MDKSLNYLQLWELRGLYFHNSPFFEFYELYSQLLVMYHKSLGFNHLTDTNCITNET